jgi:hypothetical protein
MKALRLRLRAPRVQMHPKRGAFQGLAQRVQAP